MRRDVVDRINQAHDARRAHGVAPAAPRAALEAKGYAGGKWSAREVGWPNGARCVMRSFTAIKRTCGSFAGRRCDNAIQADDSAKEPEDLVAVVKIARVSGSDEF